MIHQKLNWLRRAPAVLEVISEVGRHHGAKPAQVALAWLLLNRQVMVIPGARSVAQLETNAAAADLQLTPGDAIRIEPGRLQVYPENL